MDTNEKRIGDLFDKGILINKELLNQELDADLLDKITTEGDLIVLNSDYSEVIKQEQSLVDWYDVDVYRVGSEKDRDDELYQMELQSLRKSSLDFPSLNQEQQIAGLETTLIEEENKTEFVTEAQALNPDSVIGPQLSPNVFSSAVTITVSYESKTKKYDISDFGNFFLSRYRFLEGLLRNRRKLVNTSSISRLSNKKERDAVSIIGLVDEIGETKNGNLMITIEDLTGKMKVLISKNKKDLFAEGKDLVVDEVVGIAGVYGDKIIFAEDIVWPDLPPNVELKKGEEEEYAVFLSDIHVGSTLFLSKEFNKFLSWISGETGTQKQREMAQKVKYVFIAGDLVDGVGIYPGQEDELDITDIKLQYAEVHRLLKKIPQDKQIIMCPGNHDVVHLAEPQPIFYPEYTAGIHSMPNVTLTTNPSLINIGKTDTFSGFKVLMYHGYSFDYYVANVESIRTGGGYRRSDLIMKFLLKRRHLAPSFKSTPYCPSYKDDPLLIREIPDFFLTGHIHYSTVSNYKGITMICGSCWQAKSTFQEKLGHEPEPGRVPVVNLKTREVKVLRF